MSDILLCHPTVFAVGDQYQIIVPVVRDALFSVTVGGKEFHDHAAGVLRSAVRYHKVTVPMELLDREKRYVVTVKEMVERAPYFPVTKEPESFTYDFRPLPEEGEIRAYFLADTHGQYEMPVAAGGYFGDALDLLILGGDIADFAGHAECFDLPYRLASALTGGRIPCLYARGNHDMRGQFAEKALPCTPNDNGRTYYTARLGALWALILDVGEDKPDAHAAYGGTIDCTTLREDETAFLRRVIRNKETEYAAGGIKYRLLVIHYPLSSAFQPPLNADVTQFTAWLSMLRDEIKPQLTVAGHEHIARFVPSDEHEPSPLAIAAKGIYGGGKCVGFIGGALVFGQNGIGVSFTDHEKTVCETYSIGI